LTTNYNVAKKNAVQKKILWEKPMHGGRKLNIDASFYMDGSGAMGAIQRVHKCEAITSMVCTLENVLSAASQQLRKL
jgi:hypothetical protein